MPELPEVETIVRELRPLLTERKIESCSILMDTYLETDTPEEFIGQIEGRAILSVERRGKYILWKLPHGTIVSHLGMTGKYMRLEKNDIIPKHTIAIFRFDNFNLILNDMRRFGLLLFAPAGSVPEPIASLGPEPFSDELNPEYLTEMFKVRSRPIKEILMDQGIIAGLGNIYACEVLFRMKIHPLLPGSQFPTERLPQLITVIREILNEAIQHSGTTISNYKRVDDKSGEYQDMLMVYGREGEPCRVCGIPIARETSNGRSAFYCPSCQLM
jgi:formamidopyrimidine-DNA glycosylase